MHLGKAPQKLALSCSHRRLRLGVGHHGTASTWTAPSKDQTARVKVPKKRR